MKLRNILIHFLTIAGIIAISFGSVLAYKVNPEFQEIMQKIKPGFDLKDLYNSAVVSVISLVVIIYAFYFLVFKFLIQKKAGLLNIIYSLLVLSGCVALQLLMGYYFSINDKILGVGVVISNYISAIIFGGVGLGIRAIVEFFNDKEKKKELIQKNLEGEVNLLRSQINPHFLFNTLNNIDAMIRKNPEKASELLIKLSVQMRYMLYDSNTPTIDMQSEIRFVEDYISLQKLRIKNQDAIQFIVEREHESILIPPMLFIPFIENAFKHCCDFNKKGAIFIRIKAVEGKLLFEAKNCYDKHDTVKDKTGGIGVDLAKRRLALLYPEKHLLKISEENNWYHVELKILLNEN